MSSLASKPVSTNLPLSLLVMDDREDGKDGRYYCLPPYYGTPGGKAKSGSGYACHLVSQGHRVGIHDDWLQAKSSVTGFPHSAHRGYDSVDECIEAWQRLCPLGIHPHPVDPQLTRTPTPDATPFVNISPRKGRMGSQVVKMNRSPNWNGLLPTSLAGAKPKQGICCIAVYADVPVRVRTHERYMEMQRRGQEPDMLVTRNVLHAAAFALDEEADVDAEVEGGPSQ
ncbi:hypothetical protein C8R47DRAFT_1215639 [Mycena vitilis]|nr:hypothetical protein C8R47DRAFT_1215639 [Mycena vitilis]